MKKQILSAVILFATASTSFAGTIEKITSSDTVRTLVSTIANQSQSGDPAYCSFKHARLAKQSVGHNTSNFKIVIPCGYGNQRNHMENLNVSVKGYIEDSQVLVTSVSISE